MSATRPICLIIFFVCNTTTLVADVNFNVAWGPQPANNATNVHYKIPGNPSFTTGSVTLSWQPGDLAKQHDVYFGTSSAAVNSATTASTEYKGSRYDANNDPCDWTIAGTFATNTSYYWRIDETNDSDVLAKGQVWTFKTHTGRAYNPRPADGQVGLTEPLSLSWTAGDWAQDTNGHRVFVGTDYTQVFNATTSTYKIYRGVQTPTSYALTSLATNWFGPLVTGKTYYWKIVEVNGTTTWAPSLSVRYIWAFTPAEYVNIDDFESYETTDDVNANWQVGYTPASPDCIDFGLTGNAGLALIRDANGKHLQYTYRNGGNGVTLFSETKRSYNPGTPFKLPALHIDYRGSTTNSADPVYDRMYVVLEDTAGNVAIYVNPDPNAAKANDWVTWVTNFGYDPDVNMASISSFCLGFGVRCNDYMPGGDGNVLFDNIRLFAQTCVPEFGPEADFDEDCYVGLEDLRIMAQEWLTYNPPGSILLQKSDLNDDRFIDFKDFAIMGQEWRTLILWP